MISLTKPQPFEDPIGAVGCFIECDDKILLLHRNEDRPEGNTWCAPGGKIDPTDINELAAIKREVFEETGIIASDESFTKVATFYISYPSGIKFIYHKFLLKVNDLTVKLNDEHQNYKWCLPTEALSLPLIKHEEDTIKHVYQL